MHKGKALLVSGVVAAVIAMLLTLVTPINRSGFLDILYFPAMLMALVLDGRSRSPGLGASWGTFLCFTLVYVGVFVVMYAVLLEIYLARRVLRLYGQGLLPASDPNSLSDVESLNRLGAAVREVELLRRGHFILKARPDVDPDESAEVLGARTLLASSSSRAANALVRDLVTGLRASPGDARLERLKRVAESVVGPRPLLRATGAAASRLRPFATVHESERAFIERQRRRRLSVEEYPRPSKYFYRNDGSGPSEYWGLALSGGGIRSASFALGVLQALDRVGALRAIDYLSTVSGGGYIGSALTWQNHINRDASGGVRFPFGTFGEGARSRPGPSGTGLDFLRFHGDYLRPTPSLGDVSLVGVVLRAAFLSLVVFFGLSVVLADRAMWAWDWLKPVREACRAPCSLQWLADWGEIQFIRWPGWMFILFIGAYGVATFVASLSGGWRDAARDYRSRLWVQRALGYLLIFAGVSVLDYLVPAAYVWWNQGRALAWVSIAAVLIVTVLGGLVVELLRDADRGLGDSERSGGWVAILAASGVAFLWAELAYAAAMHFAQVLAIWKVPVNWVIGIVAFLGGLLVNGNYFGLHRMYRDRLMETFMPEASAVAANAWAPAKKADTTYVWEMNGVEEVGPYQLVNTNIVLTDHPERRFTSRGGDNFVFSHAFCGADSLGGWVPSREFENGRMSWGTAMAISGAAVSPDSAVAGDGVTRSRLVAFVMSMFNVRLGYWAANPVTDNAVAKLWQKILPPTLIYPGLLQGLFGLFLGTRGGYLQLTDGGHFDNTGLYELIRRELDVIILSDAGADGNYEFGDLANAMERVRADFGVSIRFLDEYGLDQVTPLSDGTDAFGTHLPMARRGYAVANIDYGSKHGLLVVLKPTLIRGLPHDVYRYRSEHSAFPSEPTTDQLFGEKRLDAYRELGYQLTKACLHDAELTDWFKPQ